MSTGSRAARVSRSLVFAPFRFDIAHEELWLGDERVSMRPKTRAVLVYLIEHRDRTVSRDELCQAIWPGGHGTEHAPKQCIRELRTLLDDQASAPRFLETAGRDGYRFIGQIEDDAPAEDDTVFEGQVVLGCVGRAAELARLNAALDRVRKGRSLTLLVRGEPGVGKSTLVDAFVDSLEASRRVWITRAECTESAQGAEPYAPLLVALARLARKPGAAPVVATLERFAPSWLAQIPGLVSPSQYALLERTLQGTTPQRMLRELGHALEDLTTGRSCIVVLEDLQWCDGATLDWLAGWVRGRNLARLLIVGTMRADGIDEPALRRVYENVQGSTLAEVVELTGLTEDTVEACLRARYGSDTLAPLVARALHERTRGHPLFVVALLEDWHARGLIWRDAGTWQVKGDIAALALTVPQTVNQLIEAQVAGLDERAQRVLEAASVAGPAFAAATAAAALGVGLEAAEEACERLARRQGWLEAVRDEEWADGTVSTRYAFRHVIYQQVLVARVPAARRVAMQLRIAERLERGFGPHTDIIAAELAVCFEAARDFAQAARYSRRAGEIALRRHAPREAAQCLRRALAMHARARESRSADALEVLVALGAALIGAEGFGGSSVARTYRRAYALCRRLANLPRSIPVLCGLWNYSLTRADLESAEAIAKRLAEALDDAPPADRLAAHNAIGQTYLFRGEPTAALAHIDAVLSADTGRRDAEIAASYGEDPGVVCRLYGALVSWLIGDVDAARVHLVQGMRAADELAQPGSVAQMLWARTVIDQLQGDAAQVQQLAAALIAHCRQYDIAQWLPLALVLHGWGRAMNGHDEDALDTLQRGIDESAASGTWLIRPYSLGLMAEARAASGDIAGGLAGIGAAIGEMEKTGERWYAAALYRLKAELTMRRGGVGARDEARLEFDQARAVAQRQGARSFERQVADSMEKWLG